MQPAILRSERHSALARITRDWCFLRHPWEEKVMTMTNRILLSIAILFVDVVIFFLPLTALFLIYILLYNPPWFRNFLQGLNSPGEGT
jgi:hypothetical protein